MASPSNALTPFSLCGLKLKLVTPVHSHGKSKCCMASALMVSPKTVLGGSKLNSTLASVVLTNVAVTVMVLAPASEARPVSPFLTNVPMKMERGVNDPPPRAEMTGGLVAGESGAMANLRVCGMKR